jgi:hypothetical protein
MTRATLTVAAALAALALPALAAAKEPTAATIEGPGLGEPLTIQGSADDQDGSPLARLVVAGGIGAAMFGHRSPDPMSPTQPPGDLGPRYSVTYVVGGPYGKDYELAGEIYPYAKPRPLTYMQPGQSFFETFRTHGGWFVGGPKLRRALLDAGLPSDPPDDGGRAGPSAWMIELLAAGAVGFAAIVISMRRRRRGSPAPA